MTPRTSKAIPSSHDRKLAAHSGLMRSTNPATIDTMANRMVRPRDLPASPKVNKEDEPLEDPQEADQDRGEDRQPGSRLVQLGEGEHSRHQVEQTEQKVTDAGPGARPLSSHRYEHECHAGCRGPDGDQRGNGDGGLGRPHQEGDPEQYGSAADAPDDDAGDDDGGDGDGGEPRDDHLREDFVLDGGDLFRCLPGAAGGLLRQDHGAGEAV